MATNLLIASCGIPLSATATTSLAAESGFPLTNLFGGSRVDTFRVATAASGDERLTFDLGASATAAANFIYIARAKLLKTGTVGTITLKAHSSNDYGAATTVTTISSFGSATLRGPNAEDYIGTFSTSSAYRWWFVNYNASSATKFEHSHLFFGMYFDPGRDPNEPVAVTRTRDSDAQKKSRLTFELTWRGLTYDKTLAFHDLCSKKRQQDSFVLFTTSYHPFLLNYRALHVRLLDFTAPPVATDVNEVSAVFQEIL